MRFSKFSYRRRRALSPEELAAQLVIDLQPRAPVWVDPDDVPEEGDFPEHRIVRAEDCERPKTRAACSIFALAQETGAAIAARQVISEFMLGGLAQETKKAAKSPRRAPVTQACVIREAGITRHIAVRYQDTDEWAEKERIRRAKQKPPRPKKQKFAMKGTRQWADVQS